MGRRGAARLVDARPAWKGFRVSRCPVQIRDATPDDATALVEVWGGAFDPSSERAPDADVRRGGGRRRSPGIAADPDQRLLVRPRRGRGRGGRAPDARADLAGAQRGRRLRLAPPRARGLPPPRRRPGPDRGHRRLGRGEGHQPRHRRRLGRARATPTASWPGWGSASSLSCVAPPPRACARSCPSSRRPPPGSACAATATSARCSPSAGRCAGPAPARPSPPTSCPRRPALPDLGVARSRVAAVPDQPAPDQTAQTDRTDQPERPRLLLLDGHSLAYRAFFALPVENFSTTTGQHTNAVYGFTSMLINVLRDEQPTHVGVAFDVSRQTFRARGVLRLQGQPLQVARRVLRPGLPGQGGARRAADPDGREGRLRGRRRHRHAHHAGGRAGLRGADLHRRPRLLPARRRDQRRSSTPAAACPRWPG